MSHSHPKPDYYSKWIEALGLHLNNKHLAPAHKTDEYQLVTLRNYKYASVKRVKFLTSPVDAIPLVNLRLSRSRSTDSDFSSSISSEEGAEFLFGWAESRRERRHANRELKRNTRVNGGMYKVKERLAIFREEEECGFCFGEDSDGELEEEEEDDVEEVVCGQEVCEDEDEDEEVFDGGEREESEDADSFCGDGDGDEDGSSVGLGEEMGEGEDEEEATGNQKADDDGHDEEMKGTGERGKARKRKAKKFVSWKDDEELAEIHIVKREDLSMSYVFGQERAMMMKEDGTSKFASTKATTRDAPSAESTTKKTARVAFQRIDLSQEEQPYVFGQQQAITTKVDLQKSDYAQEVSSISEQEQANPTDTKAGNITFVQTKEKETFGFGRQSLWKDKPKHGKRTRITVTEVGPETITSESEEAFVFGKQAGVWRKP